MSLRSQTYRLWACEIHNDDPTDPFPSRLIEETGDDRFQLIQHPRNLGPVRTFNLFYQPTTEPFYAILEDDNTWEPQFLERMLDVLAARPWAVLAWCNQRIDEEDAAGNCRTTGRFVNSFEAGDNEPRAIRFGQMRQLTGALHANGAMLMRSRVGQSFPTPEIPFASVEAFRERLMPHPIVYVPEALATFTVTRGSARSRDGALWNAMQVALAATFLRHAGLSDEELATLWVEAAHRSPPITNILMGASLVDRTLRRMIKHSTPLAWARFLRHAVGHPSEWWSGLRSLRDHPDWWEILDRATAMRFREAELNAESAIREADDQPQRTSKRPTMGT
jgi:hypothetical protein